ncbi:Uncharacterised protein [Neisseria meningitidis]|nr:Uncharacterised protein [Neisseria meningitidis]CWS42071.1 Uncharacterised protein [Neisseria meningitidis]
MDGFADVCRVAAHFDGKADFADHVATVRTDNAAADDAAGFGIENQLGKAVVATVGNRTAGSRPREVGFGDFAAGCFGGQLGFAHPRHFGGSVGNARNHARVEVGFVAGAVFGGNVAFVNGFVRQHRLTDDVADGVDVRHIGTHLFVHFDEAAIGYGNACFFRADEFAVGRAAGGNQYGIVALRLFRRICTFKGNVNAVFFRLDCNGFGVDHNVVKTVFVLFLPYFYQIAVCALHQAVHHFNHIQTRTQRAVNRTHLETDNTAADNQQFARYFFQSQCAAGIDDARIFRNERQFGNAAACCNDTVFEGNDFFLAGRGCQFVRVAGSQRYLQVVRI